MNWNDPNPVHPFREVGPGRTPVTVKGCIVCPECYRPRRDAIHAPKEGQ